MKHFKDQLNRSVTLNTTPKRIVSLVPSQTELLVDLGLRDSIVGVTKFCVHPKDLRKEKTIVGGTKTIKVDTIKALQPDIILCNKEENSEAVIAALESVAPIHISDIYTLDNAFEMIRMYGEIFDVKLKSELLISEIQNERQSFQNSIQNESKPKVAYFIWNAPYMVAAADTFIDAMLQEAEFVNVFQDETRYPEISLSHSTLQDADAILLSSEPFPFKEKHVATFKALFPKKQIKIVDGELFSWYGSRLKKSFQYFKSLNL